MLLLGPHATQVEADAAPVEAEAVPAGQEEQVEEPSLAEYEPGGHGKQTLPPTLRLKTKVPAAHLTQAGCTPPDQDQLPSMALRASVAVGPAEPWRQVQA